MKKPLLEVMFASEKRKNVLLSLREGPQEMETLLGYLNTNRQALLPQIRILEEHYIVSHTKDTYELTTIGKLIVDEMALLVGTLDTFDIDIDYWGTRDLSFIPPHLFERMNELGGCKIIKPHISDMYDLDTKITDSCYISDSVNMVAASFHPGYPALFSEMANKNVNVNAIFSKDVLDNLQKNYYAFLEEMARGKSFNIYVHTKSLDFLALVVNDFYILIRLLTNDRDSKGQYILCNNPIALGWGKELFDHYMKDSVPLSEIMK